MICVLIDALAPPAVAVAVIVAVPAECPVTSPVPLTLAMLGADEFHATVAAITLPFWSRALALSWMLEPTTTDCADAAITTVEGVGEGPVPGSPPEQAESRSASVSPQAGRVYTSCG